jgi:hypothetical protein
LKKSNKQDQSSEIDLLITPETVGLNRALYESALKFLFDRPERVDGQKEWYWSEFHEDFEATPLEWTRIQTVLFSNAGKDLALYSNEQVGMGLNYIMSNGVSDVAFAAIDPSVPLEEAILMLRVFPCIWKDCFAPRMEDIHRPIGSGEDMLSYVCYMWFDVSPTFRKAPKVIEWRQGLETIFCEMLKISSREVFISALHGIGHCTNLIDMERIEPQVKNCLERFQHNDPEIVEYAHCALVGNVQ